MGLFYDQCPECGNKVSKRARFCSNCGHGAPEGWIKCPQCGKWVGNDSQYCPHCHHPLHPEDRIDLAGGVWDRESDCFAQRFELDDVRFIRESGLLVQEGTSAILLDGGSEVKVLGAGRHTPTGTLRSLNWLGNPPPRSAVMVDSGDEIFRIEFKSDNGTAPSLRSAEELPVSAEAEVTIRFSPSKAENFMQNFMKDQRKLMAKDVCQWMYQEALSAVRDICQQSKIEDLVKDPDRRERFEEAIVRALKDPLARCGLDLIRVGAVEFFGEAYEDMRQKYGELEKQQRIVEYEKKQLELVAELEANDKADKLRFGEQSAEYEKAKAKREQETADYLAQLAQEKELGEIDRAVEQEVAVLVAKGSVKTEEAKQQLARQAELHAIELKGLTNKLELDTVVKDYDLADRIKKLKNDCLVQEIQNNMRMANEEVDQAIAKKRAENDNAIKLKNATVDAEIKKIGVDADIDETMKWLQVKKLRIEVDVFEKEQLQRIEQLKVQAEFDRKLIIAKMVVGVPKETAYLLIVSFTTDQAMRDDLLKLYDKMAPVDLFKMQSTMTWEQLLALAANNPNAATAAAGANALARVAEAGEKASQEALKVYREAETSNNNRIDEFVRQIHDIAFQSVVRPNPVTVLPSSAPNIVQH